MAMVAAVLLLGATAWVVAPAVALDASRLPTLWPAEARPADLVEHTPTGNPLTDEAIDGIVAAGVDLSQPSAEVDGDGCRSIPVITSSAVLPWFDPFSEANGSTDGTYEAARLCDGPDGAATIVEITGQMPTGGALRAIFARPAADRSFHSITVEYSLDFCYVTAPEAGFPAPAGDVGPYLEQAWNLDADPSVDCADRSAPPVVTSTTTTTGPPPASSTTSSSTTTTAPAAAGGEAVAAVPVAGSAGYTG